MAGSLRGDPHGCNIVFWELGRPRHSRISQSQGAGGELWQAIEFTVLEV